MKTHQDKIKALFSTALLMGIGLVLFKYIPTYLFGTNILFDASMHIVVASFILYLLYFFVDQNKSWRIYYLIFSLAVLIIISIQRIISNNHNDIGLLFGIVISIVSIMIPRWKELNRKFKF
ncbi:MAG: hypothetical protein Q7R52_05055 [archaeon]|nr:hypothetical protein [archaeon]